MTEQDGRRTTQDGILPDTSISYFHTGWFLAVLALIVLSLAIAALRLVEGPSLVLSTAWESFKTAGIYSMLLYYSWRWWSHKGYLPKVISHE